MEADGTAFFAFETSSGRQDNALLARGRQRARATGEWARARAERRNAAQVQAEALAYCGSYAQNSSPASLPEGHTNDDWMRALKCAHELASERAGERVAKKAPPPPPVSCFKKQQQQKQEPDCQAKDWSQKSAATGPLIKSNAGWWAGEGNRSAGRPASSRQGKREGRKEGRKASADVIAALALSSALPNEIVCSGRASNLPSRKRTARWPPRWLAG